ncbi:MAG: hypothetical protein IKE62_01090 [Oscillospiraceae bacterium]|nr:hypothetical protein [Oscillospiraceae bacterium]
MKHIRLFLLTALCAVLAVAFAAPARAASYADGDYTVPFSIEGLGRHNVAWDTATVHVEGGELFVDFTIERVDPRNHPPQYDWVRTSLGTVEPVLDEENFTASFYRVPVPDLGSVEVSMLTSGMSSPVTVDYVIFIDDSSIPQAAELDEPSAEPTPTPSAEPTPTPSAEPTPTPSAEPTPTPSAEPTPTPSAESTPTPSAEPAATPSAEPAATPSAEPTAAPSAEPAEDGSDKAAQAAPDSSAIPAPYKADTAGKSGTVTVIIIVAAVVVIAAAAALILRKKK